MGRSRRRGGTRFSRANARIARPCRDEPRAWRVTSGARITREGRRWRAACSTEPVHDRPRPAHFTPDRLPSSRLAPPGRSISPTIAIALALLVSALPACSRDADGRSRASNGDVERADRQPPVIPPASEPYREVPVPDGGTVSGVVTHRGDLPAAAEAPSGSECAAVPRRAERRTGDRLGETVVWLADARAGKALPLERRYAMAIAGCAYTPRVQAALAGGTLNVLSEEAIEHRTALVRQASRDTTDVVAQFLPGQLVPVRDALTRPGLVEVACAKHPWARAWVAVFDHPYHDITGADGAFSLEQVPPGEYTLMAWHPRLGRTERKVTVTAGGTATVEVGFGK
jgi:hypothetical protein